MKIELRSDPGWPKLGLEPKFHEPGTFGGFRKCEQTDRHTSCFISIDIDWYEVYKKQFALESSDQVTQFEISNIQIGQQPMTFFQSFLFNISM